MPIEEFIDYVGKHVILPNIEYLKSCKHPLCKADETAAKLGGLVDKKFSKLREVEAALNVWREEDVESFSDLSIVFKWHILPDDGFLDTNYYANILAQKKWHDAIWLNDDMLSVALRYSATQSRLEYNLNSLAYCLAYSLFYAFNPGKMPKPETMSFEQLMLMLSMNTPAKYKEYVPQYDTIWSYSV